MVSTQTSSIIEMIKQFYRHLYPGLAFILSVVLIWVLLSADQNETEEDVCTSCNLDRTFRTPSQLFNLTPIEKIRRDCGELCNTNRPGTPGIWFEHVSAKIKCDAIFKNPFIDREHGMENAPKEIPKVLWHEYTMNNRLPVYEYYFDEHSLGKRKHISVPVWTQEELDEKIAKARADKLSGNYGIENTNALRDGLKHAPGVKGGRVLVIGSVSPWAEACVMEAGAKEIVTLEYGKLISKIPNIKTIVPYEFRMAYLNNTLGEFDAVVTFSSVEHSGLGRYGDALNPWGDIIAIARAWCVTKEGGSLTIGVEYNNNMDYIRFNADRCYGKIRYPYLTTNWKQYYRGFEGPGIQRVHVFIK